jgi:hypothetical protein
MPQADQVAVLQPIQCSDALGRDDGALHGC